MAPVLRWALAAGLCLLAATPVAAQTTSASVFGQVKDSPRTIQLVTRLTF